ncbi:activating signal cointegrator 1 [Patella vulgata]|uniref:activating signal cointegrator 1 n=1 Tax=Patella vulgata TaxID=6465 RepID=UPI00217FF285|nr:activating signal cointegrator 1 [Patella vulgata]
MAASSIEEWVCRELSKLGIDTTPENASYILSIENNQDLEDYMNDLLDKKDPKVRIFVQELLRRSSSKNSPECIVLKKNNEEDVYFAGSNKIKKKNKAPKNKQVFNQGQLLNGHNTAEEVQDSKPSASNQQNTKSAPVIDGTKKKSKFVPLFSQEGQAKSVIKLSGRHVCECQAAKHKLISNCLKCGRVVCAQEGSGPCLFCGNLVCTKAEFDIISKGNKQSEKLRSQLMGGVDALQLLGQSICNDTLYTPTTQKNIQEGAEKAKKHKDTLLHYDKTSVKRTKVLDDECDYFATDSNKWLNPEDRQKLKEREEELRSERHASRRDRKITFDFAGRKVIDAEKDNSKNMYDVDDEIVQQVHYGKSSKSSKDIPKLDPSDFNPLVNPTIVQPAPQFVATGESFSQKLTKNSHTVDGVDPRKKSTLRIQDKELQEMSDEGMCLSMHQPWASLLTKGIKIHEGRTWYTAHRGKLWIAATSKTPSLEETTEVEQFYRYHYEDENLSFPSHYPVGCLLGCVDFVDCLSQDEYRQKFPEGESASPYVFICQYPQELIVKFPMKGKHKIYKLDPNIHQGAKKGLRQLTDV